MSFKTPRNIAKAQEIAARAVFEVKACDDALTAGQAAQLVVEQSLLVMATFTGGRAVAEALYELADKIATLKEAG